MNFFRLRYNASFLRAAKKIFLKNPQISKKVQHTLEIIKQDPFYNSLNSHKVCTLKYGISYSARVTGDLRILWDYSQNEVQVLDILDIGGHSGKNKVYN